MSMLRRGQWLEPLSIRPDELLFAKLKMKSWQIPLFDPATPIARLGFRTPSRDREMGFAAPQIGFVAARRMKRLHGIASGAPWRAMRPMGESRAIGEARAAATCEFVRSKLLSTP